MSLSVHLSCGNVHGYILSDGKSFSSSGISGLTVAVSPYTSHANHRTPPHVMIGSMKCVTKKASFICEATSGGYRRNPDFSRQNRHIYRGRNRQTEDRRDNSFETHDETEMLSSRNGPLLPSLSNSPKFQATAAPGPREKEIVELFRKVQAKLRERASAKEEKKIEVSQERSKESETVHSLLKLLRKHSGDQGNRKVSTFTSQDFGSDEPKEKSAYGEDQSSRFSEFRGKVMDEAEELNNKAPSLARPASSFRKKSPVSQFKPQPSLSDENAVSSMSDFGASGDRKPKQVDLEDETEYESESDPDSELEPQSAYRDEDEDVVGEASSGEVSDVEAEDLDNDEESEEDEIEHEDLSTLKLTELRILAKSRGLKGFSKMKKGELVELLSGSSV